MGRDDKLDQAGRMLDRILNVACAHIQEIHGQDDGGPAGNWFSGAWDEELVDDLGHLWREPAEAPFEIPEGTVAGAVPYLALANIAQCTGHAVPRDFRDRFLATFEGYIAEEIREQAERSSPRP